MSHGHTFTKILGGSVDILTDEYWGTAPKRFDLLRPDKLIAEH